MYRHAKSVVVSVALMTWLFTSPAFSQVTDGQKVETSGMITTRTGDNLTINSKDLGKVVVVLKEDTKVQVPKGIFRHQDTEWTRLIPGLQVDVKGVGDANGQIVADQVRFTKESLKVAQQVEAATEATRGQVANNAQGIQQNAQTNTEQSQAIAASAAKIGENTADIKAAEDRFDNLTEFDVKKDITVTFETGKSDLSDDAKQQLTALAQQAQGMKGYLIEVKGFASTSGDADRNQELSDDRGDAVVTFLHQQGVDLRHIVTPAAMGTTNPVSGNDTEEGRLKNQRVEVKLMVNRGLAGK